LLHNISKYEIKMFLKVDKVLNSHQELEIKVLDEINGLTESKSQEVRFIDTREKIFSSQGWILRSRIKAGDNKNEITFKKRYPLHSEVGEMLEKINQEGINLDNPNLDVEIDWGFSKKTLSLSWEMKVPLSQSATFSDEEVRKLFADQAPEEFIHWNQKEWSTQLLRQTTVIGPIQARKYKGHWDGEEISLEIWTISSDIIVEISLDIDDDAVASQKHEKLKEYLNRKDLLIEQDFSKTQWAMEQWFKKVIHA